MNVNENQSGMNNRGCIHLRGALAVILGVAVVLALLRPQLREASHWVERRIWLKVYQDDLFKHIEKGRFVAEEFLAAIHTGKLDVARRMMTTGCKRRLTATRFAAFVATNPVVSETWILTNGFITCPEGRPVSEYVFHAENAQKRSTTIIKIILVSEHGEVKVDRVKVEEPE